MEDAELERFYNELRESLPPEFSLSVDLETACFSIISEGGREWFFIPYSGLGLVLTTKIGRSIGFANEEVMKEIVESAGSWYRNYGITLGLEPESQTLCAGCFCPEGGLSGAWLSKQLPTLQRGIDLWSSAVESFNSDSSKKRFQLPSLEDSRREMPEPKGVLVNLVRALKGMLRSRLLAHSISEREFMLTFSTDFPAYVVEESGALRVSTVIEGKGMENQDSVVRSILDANLIFRGTRGASYWASLERKMIFAEQLFPVEGETDARAFFEFLAIFLSTSEGWQRGEGALEEIQEAETPIDPRAFL